MMISQFVEQVQILMDIQQIKMDEAERFRINSKYTWLCSKKVTFVMLSFRHEFKIRQALTKLSLEHQIDILRKLMKWLKDHPDTNVTRIPDLTLDLINNTIMANLVSETNFSRMNSFRNSLRRFSILSNRIAPAVVVEKTKSVTFKEQPMIYNISNK
ncbi:unnamed protein product [Psylliodes chrysocephalus]|uniref:Uncharacterized protein n=1 Tax=Psylliodes chrysocephalus TaxID=3402493 RepID=A0A9P0G6Q2_9CUCU|nr:unnamed protein product [Psylliodes chrysocephala]